MHRIIGNFHNEFLINQIEKLAYHRGYHKILGKNHVADVRHKAFESTPGDIYSRSDYSERFGFDPNGQIQNEFFDKKSFLIHGRFLFRSLHKTRQREQFLWQWWWG